MPLSELERMTRLMEVTAASSPGRCEARSGRRRRDDDRPGRTLRREGGSDRVSSMPEARDFVVRESHEGKPPSVARRCRSGPTCRSPSAAADPAPRPRRGRSASAPPPGARPRDRSARRRVRGGGRPRPRRARVPRTAWPTSSRKALERTRLYAIERIRREELERSNRMKDDFFGIVSHELRTPLSAILGWTRMLRLGMLGTAIARERALDAIERNAALQTKLVDDLLDVSRIVTGKLALETATVDLAAVIEAAIDSGAAHAPRQGPDRGDGAGARRARPRRLPPPAAGALEPADERDQVHPPPRADRHRARAPRGDGVHLGAGHRRGHPGGPPAPRLRALRPGRAGRPPASSEAWGSACRSCASGSWRTSAMCAPTATARGVARGWWSSFVCQSRTACPPSGRPRRPAPPSASTTGACSSWTTTPTRASSSARRSRPRAPSSASRARPARRSRRCGTPLRHRGRHRHAGRRWLRVHPRGPADGRGRRRIDAGDDPYRVSRTRPTGRAPSRRGSTCTCRSPSTRTRSSSPSRACWTRRPRRERHACSLTCTSRRGNWDLDARPRGSASSMANRSAASGAEVLAGVRDPAKKKGERPIARIAEDVEAHLRQPGSFMTFGFLRRARRESSLAGAPASVP